MNAEEEWGLGWPASRSPADEGWPASRGPANLVCNACGVGPLFVCAVCLGNCVLSFFAALQPPAVAGGTYRGALLRRGPEG